MQIGKHRVMYICVCKGVTEKDLSEIIKASEISIEQVQKACGAATDCGACIKKLQKFLGGEGARVIDSAPPESVFPAVANR